MGQGPPFLVFWETTAGCNLDCVHCRRLEASRGPGPGDLSTEESEDLIRGIARAGTRILVLSGGEPLMRPDIFSLARLASDEGMITALATNGTLLEPGTAARIRDSGISRVSISLDGATAATHDSIRGIEGSFDAAIRGIGNLKDKGISFQINATITRTNVGEFDSIVDLAGALGADALHLFMLVPVGCGAEIPDEVRLEGEEYEELLVRIHEASLAADFHIKVTCGPHYYRVVRQRGDRPKAGRPGMERTTKGCLAGTGVAFVSHDGLVFPCGYLPVTAGSVRERPFGEIWREAETFRILRDDDALGGKCGLCEFKKVCMGCRARAYAETGEMMAEEPFCIYQPGSR